MAEDTFTLTTFYTRWKAYQDHITRALAQLKASQLDLRAASHLRTIGEQALHLIACRAYWFIDFLGEDRSEEMKRYASWNEVALKLGAPVPTAAELALGLDRTWQFMADCRPVGVPTRCDESSPTTGMANKLTCFAPGSSGM